MIENRDWYTYRQAAARVRRHKRTIKKWRQRGLPMTWDNEGRRIVHHDDLLPWWRMAMERDFRNKNPHPTLFDLLELDADTPPETRSCRPQGGTP